MLRRARFMSFAPFSATRAGKTQTARGRSASSDSGEQTRGTSQVGHPAKRTTLAPVRRHLGSRQRARTRRRTCAARASAEQRNQHSHHMRLHAHSTWVHQASTAPQRHRNIHALISGLHGAQREKKLCPHGGQSLHARRNQASPAEPRGHSCTLGPTCPRSQAAAFTRITCSQIEISHGTKLWTSKGCLRIGNARFRADVHPTNRRCHAPRRKISPR
jgi:hypothetical protein